MQLMQLWCPHTRAHGIRVRCVQWAEERRQGVLYAEHVHSRPELYIEIPTLSNTMSDLQAQTADSQSGR